MATFVIGVIAFTGGTWFGVAIMCAMAAAKKADEEDERHARMDQR